MNTKNSNDMKNNNFNDMNANDFNGYNGVFQIDMNKLLLESNWFSKDVLIDMDKHLMIRGDSMFAINVKDNSEMMIDDDEIILVRGDMVAAVDENNTRIYDTEKLNEMRVAMTKMKADMFDLDKSELTAYNDFDTSEGDRKDMVEMVQKMNDKMRMHYMVTNIVF